MGTCLVKENKVKGNDKLQHNVQIIAVSEYCILKKLCNDGKERKNFCKKT